MNLRFVFWLLEIFFHNVPFFPGVLCLGFGWDQPIPFYDFQTFRDWKLTDWRMTHDSMGMDHPFPGVVDLMMTTKVVILGYILK